MAKQATTLKELAQIRADRRDFLNAIVGTQGTALGLKNFDATDKLTGDPCIIVYVPHKIHRALLSENAVIPSKLTSRDGKLESPTDVIVTTVPNKTKNTPSLSAENQEIIETLQWLNGKMDFIGPGVQVGAADVSSGQLETFVGTLGYIVRSKNDNKLIGFLTNQHVGLHSGHSLYIPGYRQNAIRVGVTRRVMEHRPDDEWLKGLDEKFAYVRTDSAFAVADEGLGSHMRNDVLGIGPMGSPFEIDLDSMDIIGMPVKKLGRTTGLQLGTIIAFGYGIGGEEEFIDRNINVEPANFYTDLLIAPRGTSTVFSAPGDSGSAILIDTDDTNKDRPVALLWGGWPTDIGRSRGVEDLTYGIGLNRILQALELELL
ncbi:MAG: hypothetical protein ACE5KZ_00150 [Candidatus Scalinduaceae bacterium]